MAKDVIIIVGALALLIGLVFFSAALFAFGFNVFAEPFNLPVIGWEEGLGAIIMATILLAPATASSAR